MTTDSIDEIYAVTITTAARHRNRIYDKVHILVCISICSRMKLMYVTDLLFVSFAGEKSDGKGERKKKIIDKNREKEIVCEKEFLIKIERVSM